MKRRGRNVALAFATLACGVVALSLTPFGSAHATGTAGTLEMGPGVSVTDSATKLVSSFGLRATSPGGTSGDVVLELDRGAQNFGVCTVHGPDPQVDFTNDGNESGNNPYPDIQCGRAYGESVAFSRCTMTAQAHAFMHADGAGANYMGPTTVNITFRKTGATTAVLTVTVWTPVRTLRVSGVATGTIAMSTCP
jgi:hypothetical protein